ncbi:bicaudal D-related protein 2-like [Nothobranchius furzeri]|uniref:BICD family-like cargo adapter 2 n=1 Tax=Nothobranchius furzeri TaxID=105023 RepID=A0A9D3BDC9_NOTFU|nr:bicaudal D-related protein 2-like [Nothobranchius furzeri]
MFTPMKNSLPSPSMEDSFFHLSSSSSAALSFSLPSSSSSPGGVDSGGAIETDLILAAELGQALLEKNEELAASLEHREREIEALEQQRLNLQRKLEMNQLESGQRESELSADLAALRAELEKYHHEGRDRRKDESEQMAQLANHNQRLVEQLSEAVTLEHTLRTELRSLREEMEDSSFSRNISLSQLENMQAENRVLLERMSHIEKQLKASEEDCQRVRAEREGLREKLSNLQEKLSEKQSEVRIRCLKSTNESAAEKNNKIMTQTNVTNTHTATTMPVLLPYNVCVCTTEALMAHSIVLQAKDEEIQRLKEELQTQQKELESQKEELKPFRSSPGKQSYSSLESELATVRQEKESLTQQLLNTIKHKVVLSQELDAWQEDMRLVICQQVQQREEEKKKEDEKEKENMAGLQRSKSLKVKGEGGRRFFASFFKDK